MSKSSYESMYMVFCQKETGKEHSCVFSLPSASTERAAFVTELRTWIRKQASEKENEKCLWKTWKQLCGPVHTHHHQTNPHSHRRVGEAAGALNHLHLYTAKSVSANYHDEKTTRSQRSIRITFPNYDRTPVHRDRHIPGYIPICTPNPKMLQRKRNKTTKSA